MRSEIIVCGRRFDIEHPVYTFEDAKGFNAYLPHRADKPSEVYPTNPAPGLEQRVLRYRHRRLLGRERLSISRLKQAVRQIVIHLDGCRDAAMCYDVLHNQRGLSVHFLVDNDGTIYQTLDVADCAFHAGGVNEISIGIELQNRGDAARFPNYYRDAGYVERSTVTCRVHGVQFLAYDFTDAQYVAVIRLAGVLARLLAVPLTSPRASSGELVWSMISQARQYEGFLGHYHVSGRKWDPGPWDFRRMLRGLGSRITFPLTPLPSVRSALATDRHSKQFRRIAEQYIESSERGVAAHFPVGPLGQSRLWHGGIHLNASLGDPVFAVASGEIVVAKMPGPCPIGDCNFVLLRHRFEAASRTFVFFSLYYHLADQGSRWDDEPPAWLEGNPALVAQVGRGQVVLLNTPVEAGALLGHVGEAGPGRFRQPQIHFAVFAAEELGQYLDPAYWQVIEGSRTSRVCRDQSIIERFDRPWRGKRRDGIISRKELRDFFLRHPSRDAFRRLVARHRSEWTPGDWESQLARLPDFAALSAEERARLYTRQIEPTLWWTADVARHAGIPEDGYVYSYHPVGFLLWYRRIVEEQASMRAVGIGGRDAWEGEMAPGYLTVDAEAADAMTDEEDLLSGGPHPDLTLEDLADGYGDDP